MARAQEDNKRKAPSPLYTPKPLAALKRAYAERYGRAQDGAYRYGEAVADINPDNKEAA